MQIRGKFLLSITLLITTLSINIFAGWPQTTKVTSDQRDLFNYFGQEVDIDGDWAIAGDYRYDSISGTDTISSIGRAYIYHRDTTTNTWQKFQTIQSLSVQKEAFFGDAVAISGNYVFVGAYGEDLYPGETIERSNVGAVYVYEYIDTFTTGPAWTYKQKLQSTNKNVNDFFGKEISIHDNVAVVGSYMEDQANGAAYFYKRDASGMWGLKEKFTMNSFTSHYNNGDKFGYSVDICSQGIVIGAPEYKEPGGDSSGVATLVWFRGDTTYNTTPYAKWTIQPENVTTSTNGPTNFGYAVSISDFSNTFSATDPYFGIAVGAPNDKVNGSQLGAVYNFQMDSDHLSPNLNGKFKGERSGSQYGCSIDMFYGTMAIGAYSDRADPDNGYVYNAGAVYIRSFWSGSWGYDYKISSNDIKKDDYFGKSVAFYSTNLFVGAYGNDFNASGTDSINGAGAAYFFFNNRDLFPERVDTIVDLEIQEESDPVKHVDLGNIFVDYYANTSSDASEELVYTVSVDTALLTAEVLTGDTLLLSFSENTNGYVNIIVTATDTAGQTAKDTFGVRITPVNDEPEFNTPVTVAKEEDPYSFTNIASDIDGDIVDIEVLGTLPSWLTLNKERVLSDYIAKKETNRSYFSYSNSNDIEIDQNGNLYLQSNYEIWKIQSNGNAWQYAGNGSGYKDGLADTAQFEMSAGLTVDQYGNVFVADYENRVIRKIDTSGVVTTIHDLYDSTGNTFVFQYPKDVIADSEGNIFGTGGNDIRKIDTDGNVTIVSAVGELSAPEAMAWLNDTEIVVIDLNMIKKVNILNGTIDTIAGTGSIGHADNADPLKATFYGPNDVVVDSLGNIYVADRNNQLIRKIGTDGVTTYAGIYGTTTEVFGSVDSAALDDHPNGLAIDGAGNIYISYQYSDINVIHYEYSLTGTPAITDVGDHEVSLIARDPSGLTDTITFIIHVDNINDAPVMTTIQVDTIDEDTELEILLSMTDASDIDGDSIWVVLLDGSNYTVNGSVIKPDTNYNGPLTVGVAFTDGEFNTDTINMSVTVNPVNDKPVVTSINIDTATVGDVYAYNASAEDIESTPEISFGYLPSWITVVGSIITGTPTSSGDTSFSVIASDGELQDTMIVNLYVDATTAIFEVDDEFKETTEITVYPNPIEQDADFVSILIPAKYEGTGSIVIFDILGHELDHQQITVRGDVTYHWDLRNSDGQKVASGTYPALVMIKTDSGELISKKIYIGIKE